MTNNQPKIYDVEDLCHTFSQPIDDQAIVQNKLERVLDYLIEEGVIKMYDVVGLDHLFGKPTIY